MWTSCKHMCNLRSMKKLLILSVLVLMLAGCSTPEKTPAEEAQVIAEGENVAAEIQQLQLQLDNGEVTEKYAQERLKQILKTRQQENSGDTEAILEKIGKQDPRLEEGIAEMIKRRQEKGELQ